MTAFKKQLRLIDILKRQKVLLSHFHFLLLSPLSSFLLLSISSKQGNCNYKGHIILHPYPNVLALLIGCSDGQFQVYTICYLSLPQMHIEAAKLLSFTEEEFVKALDWQTTT